ncbi:MAG: hypothetical protein GY930_11555 [bacterium]|nr:hypothetical protein [bacterium]
MSSNEPIHPKSPKVFGVGFHKTGTTSLGHALEHLGYRVAGAFGVHDAQIGDVALEQALERIPNYDAFQDNPWPLLFREIDRKFPGSRFILTTREPEAWLASVVKHFSSERTPMRQWIYGEGSPVGHEQLYVETYLAHNAAVRAHFADRPADLLELDLPAGEGWSELCAFLGRSEPDAPFFHSNRASSRSLWNRLLHFVTSKG